MISYREWRLDEASAVDQQINSLIDATVSAIEKAITDYVSSQKRPSALNAFGNRIGSAVNRPVGGSLTKGERQTRDSGQQVNPTRASRFASRYPAVNTLLKGSGNLPDNAGWWQKFRDRLSGFFMKKEFHEIENAVTLVELQNLLYGSGVSRLVLTEADGDFNALRQTIRSNLQGLGGKIKELLRQPKVSQRTPKSAKVPVPGEPAPNVEPLPPGTKPPEQSPEQQPETRTAKKQSYIKLALQSQGNVESFAALAKEEKAVALQHLKDEILSKVPEANKGGVLSKSLNAALKNDVFWDEATKENSRMWKLLSQFQPARKARQSRPKPQPQPTEPQTPTEPQPAEPEPSKPEEPDGQWREPSREEIRAIKKAVPGIMPDKGFVNSLLKKGINPERIIEINPSLRHLVNLAFL
jgi:hypothetical protein